MSTLKPTQFEDFGIDYYRMRVKIPTLNIYSGASNIFSTSFLKGIIHIFNIDNIAEELIALGPDIIIFNSIVTSLIAVFIGLASTYFVKLVNPQDGEQIKASLEVSEETTEEEEVSIPDRTVQLLTVDDFTKLLSRNNIIALLVFSVIRL